MPPEKIPAANKGLDKIIEEARRLRNEREKGYREKALNMYPHICGRCTREFSGKNLRMLTVHHRDHDHDNNPPDGSNWELLCVYCHDNEHSRNIEAAAHGNAVNDRVEDTGGIHKPFAGLAELLKKKQAQE